MIQDFLAKVILSSLALNLFPVDGSQLEAAAEGKKLALNGADAHMLAIPYLTAVQKQVPVKVDVNSLGIATTAASTIVVDAATDALLFGERPYDIRSIGSVTKLMAVMTYLDTQPDLQSFVTLDPKTDLVTGGRQYVAFYDSISVDHLLGAVLVGSDNSAAQSLIRLSGMTQQEFISKMNEKAKELGMSKTQFTDPTGIRASNVSTAYDLVKMLDAAYEYPVMRKYMQARQTVITQKSGRQVTVDATNDALIAYGPESAYKIVAGKTGYLPEAGFVLASTVESRGKRIHVVVMGASTRDARSLETRALAEWTFGAFRWPDELHVGR